MREQRILQKFADDAKQQAGSIRNESGWMLLQAGRDYCQWATTHFFLAEIREECDGKDYSCFDNSE
jgi:hypothetical protein